MLHFNFDNCTRIKDLHSFWANNWTKPDKNTTKNLCVKGQREKRWGKEDEDDRT